MDTIQIKCPSCGATLKNTSNSNKITCPYCSSEVIVKSSTSVSNNTDDLIAQGNEFLQMSEFSNAKKTFKKYSEKNPGDYLGWLGLLRAKTRNFTVRDNNAVFESEVKKYYDAYEKTAPEDVKENNLEIIYNYFGWKTPQQIQKELEEQAERERLLAENKANRKKNKNTNEKKVSIIWRIVQWLYSISFGFCGLMGSLVLEGNDKKFGLFVLVSGLLSLPPIQKKTSISPGLMLLISFIVLIVGSAISF